MKKEKRIIKEHIVNLWGTDKIGYGTVGYSYEIYSDPVGEGYSHSLDREYIYREQDPETFNKLKKLLGEHFTHTDDKLLVKKAKRIAGWRYRRK